MIRRAIKRYLWLLFIVIGINLQTKAAGEFFSNEDVVSFCTDQNDLGISYPAGTSDQDAFYFYSGCLISTPSPQWFIMQIVDPGLLGISIEHSDGYDIDFACYGPFLGKTKQDVINKINSDSSIYDVEDKYNFEDVYSAEDSCYPQSYIDEVDRVYKAIDSIKIYCNSLFYLLDPDDFDSYEEFLDYYYDEYENEQNCIADKIEEHHLISPPDPVQFDINNPCFRGYNDNYPLETIVDCSYSASSKEFCYIPDAKEGEWYLLLITNYSQRPGTISFNKTAGNATTNCKIIVDAMTVGPVCEGESFELDVNNAPEGASFSWRGPNGFSSTIKNPTIHNATQENAGIYTVVMVHNGVASEEVEVPVTVHKRVTTSVTKVINEGETYMFGDDIISDAGEYQGTFASEITGCDSIVNLTLIVAKYDEVIATNDGPICEGDYLKLDAYNAPENASFHWTGPNGFSATGESIILENTPHDYAGTYTVVATVNGYDLPAAQTVVTINKKSHTVIDTTISEDETYLFNGNPISSPGTYEETFTNAAGCDSVVTLELKVKPTDPISITNNGPLCEGETLSLLSFSVIGAANNADYSWTGPNGFYSDKATPTIPNVSVENSGTYSLSVSKNGVLIATVETEVVINKTKFSEENATIMQGETFLFNGRSLSEAGTYVDTFSTTTGCDSIVTLNLTVSEYDPIIITNNGPLCEGGSLSFHVTNVPSNASFSWSGPNGFSSIEESPSLSNVSYDNNGTYSLTVFVNGYALPTAETNVVVNKTQHTELNETIKQGETFFFNGENLSEAGTYQNTLSSTTGCDSIVTLNLTISDFDPIILTNNGPLCEGETLTFGVTNAPNNASFSWSGPNGFSSSETNPTLPNVTNNNSGTYSLTVSVNGYDLPVVQTNVVVNPIQYTQIDTTILQGEIYLFNGQQISTAGTYQETLASLRTGCDSIVTLNLSIKEYDPIIITNNGPLCEGETLIFDVTNAPNNATFSWSGPNGFTSNFQGLTISNASANDAGLYTLTVAVNGFELPVAETNVVINEKRYAAIDDSVKIGRPYQFNNKTLTDAGIYNDTLTSSIGCDSIVTLTLKLILSDTVIITNNGPVCEGENLALSVICAPNNATFSWSGPNGFTSNNENLTLSDAKVDYNGLYSLVVTADGKTYNAETTVLVHPIKKDTITETILDDEYYQFGTNKLNKAGTYSKTLTSVTGCDSIITLILNVEKLKTAVVSNNSPLCEGEDLLLNLDEVPEGVVDFEWKGPNAFQSTEQNPSIDNVTMSNSGSYTVKYEYRGRTFTLTTPVVVNKTRKGSVKVIIKGDETYRLGDEEYSEAGEYTATLVSSIGCDSIVHLTIIRAYEPKADLIPAEVFTPNSDGIHDKWGIKNVELYDKLTVTLYDRTGKIVRTFNSYDNLENSWDGKDDRGNNLPSTDYWYVIDVPESDKQYIGHVTLIRR